MSADKQPSRSSAAVMASRSLSQAVAVAAPSVTTCHYHITVDARTSVNPAGFTKQIIGEAKRQAALMDSQAIRVARAGLPGTLDR